MLNGMRSRPFQKNKREEGSTGQKGKRGETKGKVKKQRLSGKQ